VPPVRERRKRGRGGPLLSRRRGGEGGPAAVVDSYRGGKGKKERGDCPSASFSMLAWEGGGGKGTLILLPYRGGRGGEKRRGEILSLLLFDEGGEREGEKCYFLTPIGRSEEKGEGGKSRPRLRLFPLAFSGKGGGEGDYSIS